MGDRLAFRVSVGDFLTFSVSVGDCLALRAVLAIAWVGLGVELRLGLWLFQFSN